VAEGAAALQVLHTPAREAEGGTAQAGVRAWGVQRHRGARHRLA
jgi:hypothetical protein